MFWLVMTILLGIVGVGSLEIRRRFLGAYHKALAAAASSESRYGTRQPSKDSLIVGRILAGVAGFMAGVWLLMTVISSVHAVPAGHVGVVYQFGSIVGQRDEGLNLTAPWQNVKNANVQIQAFKFENIAAASSETQDVNFTVTLNYSISANRVQDLFRNVGPDYFNILVLSRVNQYFKDETVQYNAIEVTQKRDEIREVVTRRLGEELAPYSIAVNSLQIDNISYSAAFNDSIEQKQVATQEALRAQEVVKQREFEAQQLVAQANGRAEAQVIEAQGEADANRIVDSSLTPQILQNRAIEKLADNVTIALVPSGQGFILDPSSFLTPAK